jgi:transcriptional regulator with XRE-family HTH domain
MNEAQDFQKLLAGTRESAAYAEESALLEFTEELVRRMERDGVSRAELARRLGCSPAHVTQILRGPSNFTLASMARIAQALGCQLRFRLEGDNSQGRQRLAVTTQEGRVQGSGFRTDTAFAREMPPCGSAEGGESPESSLNPEP